MKSMTMICMAGLVVAGSQAIADDSAMTPAQQAAMKECMDKQRATNSSMTQKAMETVCMNEAKGQKDKDGNDLASAPQDPKAQH